MAYEEVIVGSTGTGILRTTFGLPVKAALDDIDNRINSFEGATKIKTVTTSVVNSTTLALDPHLTFALAPSTKYKVDWGLYFTSPAAADAKFAWNGPTGSDIGSYHWFGTGNAVPVSFTWASLTTHNTASTGSPTVDHTFGSGGLITSTAGMTLQPKYAQITANATGLIVLAGSWMTVTRIGPV